MFNSQIKQELREVLFLILFFKEDGFAFRYPMNVFFDKNINKNDIFDEWIKYNKSSWWLQLYIHSIYCDDRCSYCDCESLNAKNKKDFLKYKNYILNNLKEYANLIKKPIDSIYFWWWTFNLWSNEQIKEICNSVIQKFKLSDNYIWQVEIHPYYLTKNTLKILKDFWVNNIMLWIQSTSEKVNSLNNRKFDKNKINEAIDEIIRLKFNKVSFDFIFNLPYMSTEDLLKDLDYIYKLWERLKSNWININLEINRWDISMKTIFANLFFNKLWKEKFIKLVKYYISNSKKSVKIVDKYIDNKFLWLFETDRDEIEERKQKNTAILWIWLSSTSYIPWIIAYEDINYSNWKEFWFKYRWYNLSKTDNELFLISNNLRRWINKEIFNNWIKNSKKLENFYNFYNLFFKEKWENILMDINSDLENDLLNLYLIDDISFENAKKYLIKKWKKKGFNMSDLTSYSNLFLDYYYNRNKLYW